MNELGAVEVGLVVRPGELEQRAKERDGDRHRIDERVAMRGPGKSIGDRKAASVAVSQKSGVVCR